MMKQIAISEMNIDLFPATRLLVHHCFLSGRIMVA